jgi:uncharacterized ferritin-like protein (DUF455 family)
MSQQQQQQTKIIPAPSWSPFELTAPGVRSDAPRSIQSLEGVGDRLRAAAFAEVQAREAFDWAAAFFEDAPLELRDAWRRLARAEQRHLDWLLNRMQELGVSITERRVSDFLWHSLTSCKTARDFSVFMATAEERGRRAGERFHTQLLEKDPVTARIFGKIAEEEIAHIELALRFFPEESQSTIQHRASGLSVATPS